MRGITKREGRPRVSCNKSRYAQSVAMLRSFRCADNAIRAQRDVDDAREKCALQQVVRARQRVARLVVYRSAASRSAEILNASSGLSAMPRRYEAESRYAGKERAARERLRTSNAYAVNGD